MIKLVAIDLDGTLLNSEKKVSEKNKEMITKAKKQGVKIVLCTGRPLKSVIPLLEELGLRDEGDHSITLNGGLIQKNDTGEILSETLMSQEDIKIIHPLTQELGLTLDVVTSENVYRVKPTDEEHPSYYHELNKMLSFSEREMDEFVGEIKVNKMVCAYNDPDYLVSKLKSIPNNYHESYNIFRSGEYLFEFVDKSVSKAAGMAFLGEYLAILPSEMMALGDEENDLSMIKYAGLGVAMGNATPVIKEHAQVITKTNDESGVGYAIEQYVINQS